MKELEVELIRACAIDCNIDVRHWGQVTNVTVLIDIDSTFKCLNAIASIKDFVELDSHQIIIDNNGKHSCQCLGIIALATSVTVSK